MAIALLASLAVAITVSVMAHSLFKKELYGKKRTKKEEETLVNYLEDINVFYMGVRT